MTEVRIEHYDSEGALRLKEPVLAVYAASHHDQQHDPWFSPDQFWQRLIELYVPSSGFGMIAAWDVQIMTGYAFGSIMGQPQESLAMIGASLPDVRVSSVQEPIYFFREFAVDPGYQGKGYGRLLHDELLQTRPERLAHLLVRPDNPAKSTYMRWGWRVVGQVQPFPDAPVLDAMIHVLPLG